MRKTFATLRRQAALSALSCLLLFAAPCPGAGAQSLSLDRDRGRVMLSEIKDSVKKGYYDPNYHGMDIEARFRQAEEEIKQARSLAEITSAIAQALLELNDSHTFFIPPSQTTRVQYGWLMQMYGNVCYVMAVERGSDAEAKGLKPGDRVLSINNHTPTREDLWKMEYFYNILNPQTGLSVVVQSPGEQQPRRLDLAAKVRTARVNIGDVMADWEDMARERQRRQKLNTHRFLEFGDDLFVWRMPAFNLLDEKVDDIMGKAKKKKALILDLRGNGGGYEITLLRLIGNVFDHDVKIGDIKRRKETKSLVAKSRGKESFTGQLTVLIDSESGSAAEVFARVVQLEKRGTVIGDRTMGAVMRARVAQHQVGADRAIFYRVSVTDADVIMADGQSLERVGVKPDVPLLPNGRNLAQGRDPVLPYAASLLGVTIDPAKAGEFIKFEWAEN
jgi:C-terminal processing protease CtpA/Prc